MNFYKIENGQAVVGSGDVVPEGFTAYTEQPQDLVNALAVEATVQLKQQRIAELKQLLSTSDFKVLPDYQATKTQAENEANISQRQAWRDEIRELEA